MLLETATLGRRREHGRVGVATAVDRLYQGWIVKRRATGARPCHCRRLWSSRPRALGATLDENVRRGRHDGRSAMLGGDFVRWERPCWTRDFGSQGRGEGVCVPGAGCRVPGQSARLASWLSFVVLPAVALGRLRGRSRVGDSHGGRPAVPRVTLARACCCDGQIMLPGGGMSVRSESARLLFVVLPADMDVWGGGGHFREFRHTVDQKSNAPQTKNLCTIHLNSLTGSCTYFAPKIFFLAPTSGEERQKNNKIRR